MKYLWHMGRHYWEKAMERIEDYDFVRNFKNAHSKFLKERGSKNRGLAGGGGPKSRHELNKHKRLYGHKEGRLRPRDFFHMAAEEDITEDNE